MNIAVHRVNRRVCGSNLPPLSLWIARGPLCVALFFRVHCVISKPHTVQLMYRSGCYSSSLSRAVVPIQAGALVWMRLPVCIQWTRFTQPLSIGPMGNQALMDQKMDTRAAGILAIFCNKSWPLPTKVWTKPKQSKHHKVLISREDLMQVQLLALCPKVKFVLGTKKFWL